MIARIVAMQSVSNLCCLTFLVILDCLQLIQDTHKFPGLIRDTHKINLWVSRI